MTAGGEAIYVHAKLMIVDDEVLHVGSSNMNNRSMRLDTECDVTINAALEGNKQATAGIARIRASSLAEHLGVAPERIADVFSKSGSLIETVESLRSDGRSCSPIRCRICTTSRSGWPTTKCWIPMGLPKCSRA